MKFTSILFFTPFLFATLIHVPEDVETIQGGIDIAENGDTVLVAPGTYYENIFWPEMNGIKLIGSGEETCIIDGNQIESVIRFEFGDENQIIDNETEINNISIVNGFSPMSGGGIFCNNASPKITYTTIIDNKAYFDGGGILCIDSSPKLDNIKIIENSAGLSSDFDGYGFGGGIYCSNGNPIITNSIISNNWSNGNYYIQSAGGGIDFNNSNPVLLNVAIIGNIAQLGSGISFHSSNSILIKCTFSNNSFSYSFPSYGGGIISKNSELTILNSIFWDLDEFQDIYLSEFGNGSVVTMLYTDFQGGQSNIITNNNGTVNWLEGNLDLDPLFTDTTNGDFTLLPTSPCIDAGTPFFVLEGDTLVNMSEDEYFGSAPDMGAYEFNPNESGISVDYLQNWNLISLPVQTDEYGCNNIDETTLYSFEEGGYVNTEIDDLETGIGYWLRFDEEETCTFSGFPINETTIPVTEDWNLIGSISSPVDVNSIIDENNLIIPGTIYGFDGSYFEAETIEPGYGYWLRSSGEGEITLSSPAPLTKSRLFQPPEHLSTVADANTLTFGNQLLYFGKKIEVENLLSFSLPPKPPIGGKDIRFSGDTKLCATDECVIELMNNDNPLTFECEIKDGETWEVVDARGKVLECAGVNVLKLEEDSETLILRKSTSTAPTSFALHPAFPNPFNPVTNIQFSVPELSDIYISIYDIQGRLVRTLMKGNLKPGNYNVKWDGSGFASGIYFVQLQQSDNLLTQKIILLK